MTGTPIQPGDRVKTITGQHYFAEAVNPVLGTVACRPIYGGHDEEWLMLALTRVDPATVASRQVYRAWRALQLALEAERGRWTNPGATEAIADALDLLDQMRACISDIGPSDVPEVE